MTLLFFDGLQDPLLLPKPEWVQIGASFVIAGAGRDGSTNGSYGQAGGSTHQLQIPSAAATCIAGCAYLVNSGTGLGNQATQMTFNSALSTPQIVIYVNSSGFIEVRRTTYNGTLLGTSSGHTPVAVGSWHFYEAKVVLSSTATGSVTVRLDGVTVLTLTGIITSSVTGSVTHMQWTSPGGTDQQYLDDLYVCDAVDATGTQGRANNDFLGDLKVQTLYPTAAGDVTQLTPSTGSNWSNVDETPPVLTDYNSGSTAGNQDLYNLTDLTGTVVTVFAVRESIYANKSDAGTAQLKPLIKENAVVTSDPAQGLSTAAGIIAGTIRAVRPSDSAVWTTTDINALQAGVEVA